MTSQNKYDYIIVGSGAGGGTLAGRLAQNNCKVLLLEAGNDQSKNDITNVPVFHSVSAEDKDTAWKFFVKHYTDEKRQKEDPKYDEEKKGIFYPRAGSLGGCTVHNAQIMVYPHNSDWDKIEALTGDSSWNHENMRSYYQKLENFTYGSKIFRFLKKLGWPGNPNRRGYKGWLQTSMVSPTLLLKDKVLITIVKEAIEQAWEEGVGHSLRRVFRAFDPNNWKVIQDRGEGVALTPITTKNGRRTSTRDYLLRVQKDFPNNLTIQKESLVSKVLLNEENQAIGVECLLGANLYEASPLFDPDKDPIKTEEIYCNKEVILCGGAFNTPQLLKLSGIGPKEELEKHDIPVKLDLPGVGENLQDRYEVGVVSKLKNDLTLLKDAQFKASKEDLNYVDWLDHKGLYTSNGAIIGIIKRSATERPDPDLYIFGLPGYFKGYYRGYSTEHLMEKNYFTWAVLKGHTRNRAGRVTLNSKDPRYMPDINFRYFDDDKNTAEAHWQEDLDSVVEGVEFVRRMNKDKGLSNILSEELLPGKNVSSKDELRNFVKQRSWGHHASCSCPIGADDDKMAVLDSQFRVRGIKGLRVVDASVFPEIPGLFIVSAVYMIGEKAADDILNKHS